MLINCYNILYDYITIINNDCNGNKIEIYIWYCFFFFLSIGNKSFVVKWVHFMNFLLYWKIVKGNNRSAEFSFPKLNETECNKY